MKKIIGFIMFMLAFIACTPIFAQTTAPSIIPGIDTATIFETLSAILVAIVGHYTINSKWTSIIKWLLTVVNWLIWGLSKLKSLLDILNKTNLGENIINEQKPVNTTKISDPILAPSPAQTITDQVAAASQVADIQPTTQPPTVQ